MLIGMWDNNVMFGMIVIVDRVDCIWRHPVSTYAISVFTGGSGEFNSESSCIHLYNRLVDRARYTLYRYRITNTTQLPRLQPSNFSPTHRPDQTRES